MEFFEITNQLITPEELEAFEKEIGLCLPADYKAHMLQYNGATTASMDLFFGDPEDGIQFASFHPIKYGDSLLSGKRDYLPENYLALGLTGTGYLAMSLDEQTHGNVYVHYSEVELEFLAASFTEFIAGLIDYDGTDW